MVANADGCCALGDSRGSWKEQGERPHPQESPARLLHVAPSRLKTHAVQARCAEWARPFYQFDLTRFVAAKYEDSLTHELKRGLACLHRPYVAPALASTLRIPWSWQSRRKDRPQRGVPGRSSMRELPDAMALGPTLPPLRCRSRGSCVPATTSSTPDAERAAIASSSPSWVAS